jgi:hypothetical protein
MEKEGTCTMLAAFPPHSSSVVPQELCSMSWMPFALSGATLSSRTQRRLATSQVRKMPPSSPVYRLRPQADHTTFFILPAVADLQVAERGEVWSTVAMGSLPKACRS